MSSLDRSFFFFSFLILVVRFRVLYYNLRDLCVIGVRLYYCKMEWYDRFQIKKKGLKRLVT